MDTEEVNNKNNSIRTELENSTYTGADFVSASDDVDEYFSEETLKSISKLGDVLARIDRRMKNEGFYIKSGKITKDENT